MVLMIISISCGKPIYQEHSKRRYILKQRELLKGFAFCNCVLNAIKEDTVIQNDISGSIYLNISFYDDSAYSVIARLARNTAAAIKPPTYVDYLGKHTILYECNRFQNGKFLDSVVRTLDNKIRKPLW